MSQRDNALQIFRAAVGAVDPYRSVLRVLGREGDALVVRQGSGEMRLDLEKIDRLHVVGCGKAGAPMARAVEELVGDRISTGIVVVKYGHTLSDEASVDSIRICEGGHPKPDAAGMHRAEEILGILQGASERDLVLALI